MKHTRIGIVYLRVWHNINKILVVLYIMRIPFYILAEFSKHYSFLRSIYLMQKYYFLGFPPPFIVPICFSASEHLKNKVICCFPTQLQCSVLFHHLFLKAQPIPDRMNKLISLENMKPLDVWEVTEKWTYHIWEIQSHSYTKLQEKGECKQSWQDCKTFVILYYIAV